MEAGQALLSLQVPFAACLEKWAAPELLEGVAGAGGAKRSVLRQTRFATFPPYLLVQMRRRVVVPSHACVELLRAGRPVGANLAVACAWNHIVRPTKFLQSSHRTARVASEHCSLPAKLEAA